MAQLATERIIRGPDGDRVRISGKIAEKYILVHYITLTYPFSRIICSSIALIRYV